MTDSTNHIYVYSGRIHSGKTTRISNWLKGIKKCDGVIAPLIEGKRCLRHIADNSYKVLETKNADQTSNIMEMIHI